VRENAAVGIRPAAPPFLLHDVIDDLAAVERLLVAQAPNTPLGGWYSPDSDPGAATRPLWFQDDWVHDTFHAPGSELFLHHPGYVEAAKRFSGAEVVVPTSVYVNVMMAVAEGGPAHTDNPRFLGRDRTNTPMWVLRAMLWSGLFHDHEIRQVTAIWWMNDVEGGALRYWPDGPDRAPVDHDTAMANTALVGDNHTMFHQVGPVGPFGGGTLRVTPRAEFAPTADGSGDWAVTDRGAEVLRAPLCDVRVSVLWKADVWGSPEERAARSGDTLSMADVARTFDTDLAQRGAAVRFDLDRLDDPALKAALAEVYPEAVPIGAFASAFG
jgi:hypothetical protein